MSTKKRVYIVSIVTFFLIAVFTGCSLTGSGTETSGPPSFRVESIVNTSPADRSLRDLETPVTELWVMTVNEGNNEPIAHQNAYDILTYLPDAEGSYEIPMEELPSAPFVVFIVETYSDGTYNVLGFLSLSVDEETAIMTFPTPEEIVAPVEFGNVVVTEETGYISFSEITLTQNQSAFNAEAFDDLHEYAVFHNTGQMALNVLLNTKQNPSTSSWDYYAVGLSMGYHTDLSSHASTSADVSWNSDVSINIYSHDTTSQASLFTPSGDNLNGEGIFPAAQVNSATKFFVNVPMSTFTAQALPGEFWELRNESGEVLASFDMSVAMLTDDSGYPIMPIMEPSYSLEDGTAEIDTVDFNWFYFLSDGTTRVALEDTAVLDELIGKSEFHLQANTDGVTYMYREPGGGGAGGMVGDILTAHTFSPTLTESSFTSEVSAGYRFTLLRCSTDWNEE